MLLACENGSSKVYADTYNLDFATDRPYVYVKNARGERVADLFVLSSIHPLNGRDDTTAAGAWSVEEHLDQVVLSLEVSSSVWQSKTVRFRCQPTRFSYEVDVTGDGDIAEALYFGGYYSAQIRWGSGFFWSGQRFNQGFNPEPSVDEIYTFPAEANSTINLTGVPLPGKADWFFTPPPFCFAFESKHGWTSMGIEASPGKNSYTEYQYHGTRSAFYLSLAYEGYTRVESHYSLPTVVFEFGLDPYALLESHVQHLRDAGLVSVANASPRPEWWAEPIFCGWGAQNHLANVDGGRVVDYAAQSCYEAFLRTLASQDVIPGTVVLDDKWQQTYGDNEVDLGKWPDLPGFVRARHEEGQRVLLWIKAWAPEGLPLSECIVNTAGLPASVDPTNPVYVQRLRASVRRMLSADGYDADGFKIDFSARIPSGPGFRKAGNAWGLELMHLYLSIIRDESRRVKPDAMIITHTPHPYLSGLMDAIRLNDINTGHDVCSQMIHRARVAAIACPDALIDMDNWPVSGKTTWREYLDLRPFLGIPALYFASHIDATGEPLSTEDYEMIRTAWKEYRAARTDQRLAEWDKTDENPAISTPARNEQVKRLVFDNTPPVMIKPLKALVNESLSGLS